MEFIKKLQNIIYGRGFMINLMGQFNTKELIHLKMRYIVTH